MKSIPTEPRAKVSPVQEDLQYETAIGDCELAKILNDSLTVIFIDIYILFFVSISAIFSHFLLFSQ